MLLFLLLISIIACIFFYVYYSNKISIIKHQLLRTTNQYNQLKNKYNNSINSLNKTTIKFTCPNINKAITKSNINLYIAPIDNSLVLRNLEVMMEVQVLDKALTNNSSWLYVSLPLDTNYNCRGWIKETDFSSIENNRLDKTN